MSNFVKIVLAVVFIVIIGVACFFLGRKVESDSISNNENQITTENNINQDNNVKSNTSIEDEEFTDLVTDVVNTNE